MKWPTLALLALAWALTGCAAVLPEAARQLKALTELRSANAPQVPNDQRLADQGFAAIVEGDLGLAETYLDSALAINPTNAYALLNLGVVYQHTGRAVEARTLYTRLIALDPRDTAVAATREHQVGTPIVDIARDNLTQLDHEMALVAPPPPRPEDAERAIMMRFTALARLRDEKLVTTEEYAARRKASLGALLPLSGEPPAPELLRPAPLADHIILRLRAIGQFRDAGALTPTEYAIERAAILDALMPILPGISVRAAALGATPKSLTPPKARLDRLLALNLISKTEFDRERAAIPGTSASGGEADMVSGRTGRTYAPPAAASQTVPIWPRPVAAAEPTPEPIPPAPPDPTGPIEPASSTPAARTEPPPVPAPPAVAVQAEPAPPKIVARTEPPPVPAPPAMAVQAEPTSPVPAARAKSAPAPTSQAIHERTAKVFAPSGPDDQSAPMPAASLYPESLIATPFGQGERTMALDDLGSARAGDRIGVHLSSFRTPERAHDNWKTLRKEHGDVLDRLRSRIARVDLGSDKGVFFQLHVGPVANAEAAQALCAELKSRSLYCEPTIF